MKLHKTFPARIESLHPLFDWIRPVFFKAGLSKSSMQKVELALEEGFVNAIEHCYQEEVSIEVSLEEGTELAITLIDKGPPFDPLSHEREVLNASKPLEEIQEGGLGIFFMKECMDLLLYERKEGQNRLTLIKKLPATDSSQSR